MRMKSVFISLCMAWIFSAGCSAEKPAVTFAVGGAPSEIKFWEKLIADFSRESGIMVKMVRQPTDTDVRRQTLVTALRSKQSDPDVFLMDVAWLSQFAASGWLLPLDRDLAVDALGENVFFDRVLAKADTLNGVLIALPVYIDAGLLYYRKDLLARYGYDSPPTTWDQLAKQATKIQEGERQTNRNFYGFVWQGAQYEGLVCMFLEVAGSNNGGILFSGKNIVFDSIENRDALQFMADCIGKYAISPPNTYTEMKEEQVRIAFQNGNAAFERNWPYAWPLHQGSDSKVKGITAIAPLPCFENGRSVSTLGGWHIGISLFTDAKAGSIAFMKYVASYRVQKALALNLGWNPGRKDVYGDKELLEKMPHLGALRLVFDNATARPNVPFYSQLSEIVQRYVNTAIAGKADAGESLKKAATEMQKVMKRYEE